MPDNDIIGISLFIKKWDMTGLYEGGYLHEEQTENQGNGMDFNRCDAYDITGTGCVTRHGGGCRQFYL